MKQRASWKLITLTQNGMLNQIFRTAHHQSPLRAKQMQPTYSKTTSSKYISISINGHGFQKVSSLYGLIQISKGIWHQQYNTKQEIL